MLTPTPITAELPRDHRQLRPAPRTAGPESYLPSSVPMNFGRNAEIFAEGETAGYVYKLVSGVVRVSKLLPDGRRQISAFHLPGDMFGFEVDDVHHTSAEAVVPVKLVAFKWQSLLSAGASTGLVHELLNRTMIGLRHTQDHLLLLGRKNALERLAAFLLEMTRRSGDRQVLDLAMPRHDIADYLGLTLETVSRMFAELKEIGLVRLESARRVHLLDPARLKAMAA
ncbi:MAG: helix-turn-helix domain-containing protein [Methyloceanibacter sp.]|uniref:helix-turn-helix domain-containing protein n=1 Tax=Methyloceanibacter sp. TaxID=1965321 RepID=UPI003D6CDD27